MPQRQRGTAGRAGEEAVSHPVCREVRVIAREQDRWIKVASAFPVSPVVGKMRGINKTDWIRIERAIYDSCIDTRDYRSVKT